MSRGTLNSSSSNPPNPFPDSGREVIDALPPQQDYDPSLPPPPGDLTTARAPSTSASFYYTHTPLFVLRDPGIKKVLHIISGQILYPVIFNYHSIEFLSNYTSDEIETVKFLLQFIKNKSYNTLLFENIIYIIQVKYKKKKKHDY